MPTLGLGILFGFLAIFGTFKSVPTAIILFLAYVAMLFYFLT